MAHERWGFKATSSDVPTALVRADIFSLGVTLYELLTGKRFALQRGWWGKWKMFRPLRRLPAPIRHIIKKALEYNPEDRCPDAALILFDLLRAQQKIARSV